MSDLQIESARALLQQQHQLDDWCKRLRSDSFRLHKLQCELVSLRRWRQQRELFPSPVADLTDLLTHCRRTRKTRDHAAAVIEIYHIRCRQLLDITGIPQTLASVR